MKTFLQWRETLAWLTENGWSPSGTDTCVYFRDNAKAKIRSIRGGYRISFSRKRTK